MSNDNPNDGTFGAPWPHEGIVEHPDGSDAPIRDGNDDLVERVAEAILSSDAAKRVLNVVQAPEDYLRVCDILESSGHQIDFAKQVLRDALVALKEKP